MIDKREFSNKLRNVVNTINKNRIDQKLEPYIDKELASLLNISAQNFANYINTKRIPTIDKFYDMLKGIHQVLPDFNDDYFFDSDSMILEKYEVKNYYYNRDDILILKELSNAHLAQVTKTLIDNSRIKDLLQKLDKLLFNRIPNLCEKPKRNVINNSSVGKTINFTLFMQEDIRQNTYYLYGLFQDIISELAYNQLIECLTTKLANLKKAKNKDQDLINSYTDAIEQISSHRMQYTLHV